MPDDVTTMALQRLEGQMAECNGRLQELAKWLAGNGKVGLAEQVRNNESAIKELKKGSWTWAKMTGFAVLIGVVIEVLRYIFGG